MQTKKKAIHPPPLPFPLYVMAKPVGAVCNMGCEYCYYLEKSRLYGNNAAHDMPDNLLERFVDEYIRCQMVPCVQFTWHGGEPLLRGIDFYRKAKRLQQQYGRGREIANTIQTNGLLLNDEWCRFFRDNDFLVGISIDGPEKIHDHYRKSCGGQGTFKQAMRGIELLHKHGVEFNTLSAINDCSAGEPLGVYRFLKGIGSRYMQFAPIVERLGERPDGLEMLAAHDCPAQGEMASWSVGPVAFGKFYIHIFDEWVRCGVGKYYVQLFDATLAGMANVRPGVCSFAKTCGHALVMEHTGDVYACDHFVYPEYRRGNILHDSLISIVHSEEQKHFGSDKQDALPRLCKECKFLFLCNGECPKNRIATTADGEYGLNYLCPGLKLYFEHVYPYMEYMAEELRCHRPPANVMNSTLVAQNEHRLHKTN
jgi:uncharacterized protein